MQIYVWPLRIGIFLVALLFGATNFFAAERTRVLIETDAGGDPDDEQSLVRFLLYVNEWDVEGIIANRPLTRDGENHNTQRTGLGVVRQLVDAYGTCWTNLVQHDARYPKPEALRIVPGYDHTNAAVEFIIATVDRPDPRPLWYSDWGTDTGATNNLRRALDRVLQQRSPKDYAAFKSKLRLTCYDLFGEHTTRIAPPFELWVNTFQPPRDGKRWYHRFSGITAKAGGFDVKRDVLTGHGPLGALYPLNTTHPQKEGDTPTFLYFIPTGMNDLAQPTWGSWAGRYGTNENFPGLPYFWANQVDAWNGVTNRDNTLARWAAALQNDFRARLDWCVKPFAEANHPPRVEVAGATSRNVSAGDSVVLDARESNDPDRDDLSFRWEFYREPGTYTGPLEIQNSDEPMARISLPSAARGSTIHLILSVSDDGDPPLTRYSRIVLNVAGAAR